MTLIYLDVGGDDLKFLENNGFNKVTVTNMYEVARYKNDFAIVILYSSGKLVVQTTPAHEKTMDKLFSKNFERESFESVGSYDLKQEMIGSDEALKGDTFGGIVVASFFCTEKDVSRLKEIGVKDSKNISKNDIMHIANTLKIEFEGKFMIQELMPSEYNDLMSIETITKLLNDMHTLVGLGLKRKFKALHVVDEYPGCNVGDVRIPKAESKYLAVAAASILARARGLEQFEKLSKKARFNLTLGSTHVLEALEKLKKKKKNPKEFCKVDFKNVEEVFGL